MKRAVALLSTILLSSPGAIAAPGSAVKYLINEPASLFDIGMNELQQFFDGQIAPSFARYKVEIAATYDWKDNQIEVSAFANAPPETEKEAHALCSDFIRQSRTNLYNRKFPGLSLIPIFFSHAGYRNHDQPKELYTDLEKRVELRCTAYYRAGSVKATSKLLDSAVYFAVQKSQQRPGK